MRWAVSVIFNPLDTAQNQAFMDNAINVAGNLQLALGISLSSSQLAAVKASIAHLANMTGKSRQAIRQYLLAHFEPEVDFWIENGKIYASKETAAQIISRGAR